MSKYALGFLILLSLIGPEFGDAQQQKRLPIIGYLSLGLGPAEPETIFKQHLHDLGWRDGQNVVIEYRWSSNAIHRLDILAAELARLPVDVLVVSATPAIRAAKKATAAIPIVMMGSADPVASGFVSSLAQPKGNITGLSLQSPELAGKRLELLKEVIPKLRRVAFLAHGGDPAHKLFIKETLDVAHEFQLEIHPQVISGPAEFETAFSAAAEQRVSALVIQPVLVGMASGQAGRVANLAVKNRLPTISDGVGFPEAGGLMSYGSNRQDLMRRAAIYVDKILKGAQPANLPIEQPIKFDLVINVSTAKQIDLTIPPNVLARADRVIK